VRQAERRVVDADARLVHGVRRRSPAVSGAPAVAT
jgi:hypothetical protein